MQGLRPAATKCVIIDMMLMPVSGDNLNRNRTIVPKMGDKSVVRTHRKLSLTTEKADMFSGSTVYVAVIIT